MMQMKTKVLINKITLAAVWLCMGTNAWAQSVTTWNFDDSDTWNDATQTKITSGTEAWYKADGTEGTSETSAVSFLFASGKASFDKSGIKHFWFKTDGTDNKPETGYVKVVLPAKHKLTINSNGGDSRYCYYQVGETKYSCAGKPSADYTNSTEELQTVYIWAKNSLKDNKPNIFLSSLVIRDVSVTYDYTVTAKCGGVTLDSWTGSSITGEKYAEGETYKVIGKAYIQKDGKLYKMNDANHPNAWTTYDFSRTAIMGSADAAFDINYDEYTAGDIVVFSEGEDASFKSKAVVNVTSSGGKYCEYIVAKNSVLVTLAEAGVYQLEGAFTARKTNKMGVYASTSETTPLAQTATVDQTYQTSGAFSTTTANTTVYLRSYNSGSWQNGAGPDFYIIRKIGDLPSVTLDNSGFATFASPYILDVTSMTASTGTATAYKASVDAANARVQFSELSQSIPANTGILLVGNANATVTIPVVISSTDVDGNDFLVNTSSETFTDADAATHTYFAMKKNQSSLTFATFNPSSVAIPANKAYLKVLTEDLPSGGNARLCFSFSGNETTGIDISLMNKEERRKSDEIYNLNGQRISQPSKGLYLIGGKKVMMK